QAATRSTASHDHFVCISIFLLLLPLLLCTGYDALLAERPACGVGRCRRMGLPRPRADLPCSSGGRGDAGEVPSSLPVAPRRQHDASCVAGGGVRWHTRATAPTA